MITYRQVTISDVGYDMKFPTYKVGDLITIGGSPLTREFIYKITDVRNVIADVEYTDVECQCNAHERAFLDGAYEDELDYDYDDFGDRIEYDMDEVDPMPRVYLPYCTCEVKPRHATYQHIRAECQNHVEDLVGHWDTWELASEARSAVSRFTPSQIKVGTTYTVYTHVGFIDMVAVDVEQTHNNVGFKFVNVDGRTVHTAVHIRDIVGVVGGLHAIKRKGEI